MKKNTLIFIVLLIIITAYGYHDLAKWLAENNYAKFAIMFPIIIVGSIVYCAITSEEEPPK